MLFSSKPKKYRVFCFNDFGNVGCYESDDIAEARLKMKKRKWDYARLMDRDQDYLALEIVDRR